jgi:hypothetical protein
MAKSMRGMRAASTIAAFWMFVACDNRARITDGKEGANDAPSVEQPSGGESKGQLSPVTNNNATVMTEPQTIPTTTLPISQRDPVLVNPELPPVTTTTQPVVTTNIPTTENPNVHNSPTPTPTMTPSTGDRVVGYALVPVTAFVNMEQGYHGLEEDTIFQISDQSGVVAAGWATIEAARNGRPTDGRGAYPGIELRIDLTYVRPGVTSGSGTINICAARDHMTPPERNSCAKVRGVFSGEGDRPSSIQDERVSWSLGGNAQQPRNRREAGLSLTGSEESLPTLQVEGNLSLSTHHPVFAFAAPGRGFKDFQSPLVLDLNGNGLDLVDVWDDQNPIRFDLMGDGTKVRTGWVKPADGLLAMDRNGNGLIDNGTELFGEYTPGGRDVPAGQKAWDNGFAALGQYDANKDEILDVKDPAFSRLVVWQDKNQDGISQASELMPLAKAKVKSLQLQYTRTGDKTEFDIVANNEVRLVSSYISADGTKHMIGDVWFKQRRYSDNQTASNHSPRAARVEK